MKKVFVLLLVLIMALALFTGCGQSQAARVNHNISQQADNFNITRRLAVINMRTDKPIFELVGNFSLSNSATNELVVTVEVKQGEYKKHYVYLNDWTMYVVEDVSGAFVDPYHYEINFLPEMFIPAVPISTD